MILPFGLSHTNYPKSKETLVRGASQFESNSKFDNWYSYFLCVFDKSKFSKVILKRSSQFSSESPHWILYRPNAFNLSFQSLWNFLVVDVMHGCMVHLLITLFANLPKLSILSHKPHYSKCYLCEQPLRLSFINYLKARKGP